MATECAAMSRKLETGDRKLKGQAAIEYLMNYSWAILILSIVIGLIVASGTFNPGYFVMEECNLGPSFSCQAQIVNDTAATTKLIISVTNVMGYQVKLANLSIYSAEMGNQTLNLNIALNNSDSNISSMTFNTPTSKGTMRKFLMNITYYVCAEEVNPSCQAGANYTRFVSGRIITRMY